MRPLPRLEPGPKSGAILGHLFFAATLNTAVGLIVVSIGLLSLLAFFKIRGIGEAVQKAQYRF